MLVYSRRPLVVLFSVAGWLTFGIAPTFANDQGAVPERLSAEQHRQLQTLPATMVTSVRAIDDVDVRMFAPLDVAAIRAEDDVREAEGNPPRFAIVREVNYTPASQGTWEQLDAQTWLWRLRLQAEGARHVNLGFTRYHMPEGGRLMVYAADLSDAIRPFTHADNAAHGELWTPVVYGDDIVVEVVIPAVERGRLLLQLSAVNQGYRGFGSEDPQTVVASGSCNVDVVCPEGDPWDNEIPAVGVISTGGGTFCTGFMVNNTAQDLKPYFMTANHCGIGSGNAASLVVYWNYQNSTCRPVGSPASGGPGDGLLNQFQTGSFFRSSFSSSDFTLVELDEAPNPAWNVSFAGWSRSSGESPSGTCIHHPNTDEKRITFYTIPTTTTSYNNPAVPGDGTHVHATWSLGVTEPGSSGSPLFDVNHRVIGQLHGGPSACGAGDLSDYYGRISISWNGGGTNATRLSNWLDPGSTGAMAVDTISGGGMSVTPGADVSHIGLVGGPFTNPTVTYTLSNPTPDPLNYSVALTGSFGILLNGGTTPVTGTLSGPGGSVNVVATLGPAISGLAAGIYVESIVFDDLTNLLTTTRTHTVEIGQTLFSVTPANNLETGGPLGGPFIGTQLYTVTSDRPSPIAVEVAGSDPWISLNGVVGPVTLNLSGTGDSAPLTVGIGPAANALTAGIYSGAVTFRNLTGTLGDTSRSVALDVGRVVYAATDVPKPINDNSSLTSQINVTDAYCVGDLNVDMDITHTYIGDLIVSLQSPMGTVVRLHNRTGGTTENIVTTYDDEGDVPDGPGTLADFDIEPAVGLWTLTVSDNAGADIGSLNAWALRIAPTPGGCPPHANDVSQNVPGGAPMDITLSGSTTGGGPLTYIVQSIPANGTLSDPAGGVITTVPYTVLNNSNIVHYEPPAPRGVFDDAAAAPTGGGSELALAPARIHNFPLDLDSFTYNVNDGLPSNIATVLLTDNPGWTTQGLWAFGKPMGLGGSNGVDPTSGFTGSMVYGYNLNGDYPNNMAATMYLTTSALNCSTFIQTELRFRRRLGVESAANDHASLQVSNNGTTWTTLYNHSSASLNETTWSLQTYNISAVADGQATVYLRWGMGTTNGSVTFPGWNIDDIEIWGVDVGAGNTPLAAPAPDDMLKNRYVSFDPNNAAFAVALQVTKTTSPVGSCWVDAPDGLGNSKCVSAPVFRLWPEAVLHVGDCEIIPVANYEVRASVDGTVFSSPLAVSTIPLPALNTKLWGDVAGINDGSQWTAPNQLSNVQDIVAVLAYITNAAIKPEFQRANLEAVSSADPCLNNLVNTADILIVVQAVAGGAYPFTNNPAACPVCP